MYGLILENIGEAMRRKFGEEVWEEVRTKAGVPHHSFNMHKTYSETVVPRLVKAGSEVTGRPIDELMELAGYNFVHYFSQFGYDRVMRVLGRHLRDFLGGLDNLHEYLRFSYPKLKPPSFFCENETRQGLTLHYRSKRRGFVYFVMGQIAQIAKSFYNTAMEVELINEEETMDMTHAVMKLHFDNSGFESDSRKVIRDADDLPVSSNLFFDTFPFHVVFDGGMAIVSIGSGLEAIMPHILGNSVDEMFQLTRPLLEFTMENVQSHLNNVFEMQSVDAIRKSSTTHDSTASVEEDDYDPDDRSRCLRLKGQMVYMEAWDACMFLGTPIMDILEKMFDAGLFVNDLSMHDSSRDLVLVGSQQQAEMQMAKETHRTKTTKLEEAIMTVDSMTNKVSSLFCANLPRAIRTPTMKGEPVDGCCANYDPVTMLVSDVEGFMSIISRATPVQTFAMINNMCAIFDNLVEKHHCHRLEASGDQYAVCCGAPIKTKFHAVYICDLAIDMIEACREITDPAQGPGSNLKVKIGIMTGGMTGGVYGYKVPIFNLFGDNAMAAFKLAKAGTGGKIQVAEATKNDVDGYSFEFEDGGMVDCKNKGAVKTFWLNQRAGGSNIPLHAQVDETAEVSGNISGFVPETGDKPDLSNLYKVIQ